MAEASLDELIEALRRLPGVGQKSAQRMAYHLLQHERDAALRLAQALAQAGVDRAVINTAWLGEQISERFSSHFGLQGAPDKRHQLFF